MPCHASLFIYLPRDAIFAICRCRDVSAKLLPAMSQHDASRVCARRRFFDVSRCIFMPAVSISATRHAMLLPGAAFLPADYAGAFHTPLLMPLLISIEHHTLPSLFARFDDAMMPLAAAAFLHDADAEATTLIFDAS